MSTPNAPMSAIGLDTLIRHNQIIFGPAGICSKLAQIEIWLRRLDARLTAVESALFQLSIPSNPLGPYPGEDQTSLQRGSNTVALSHPPHGDDTPNLSNLRILKQIEESRPTPLPPTVPNTSSDVPTPTQISPRRSKRPRSPDKSVSFTPIPKEEKKKREEPVPVVPDDDGGTTNTNLNARDTDVIDAPQPKSAGSTGGAGSEMICCDKLLDPAAEFLCKECLTCSNNKKTSRYLYPVDQTSCGRKGCTRSLESEDEFIVERFIGKRVRKPPKGGKPLVVVEYLVKFQEYPAEDAEWMASGAIGSLLPLLVEQFQKQAGSEGILIRPLNSMSRPGGLVLLREAISAGWK
ncbi:hypothetical protein FRB99_001554 [Tulasnella sp. 403]|nr:hypothetical protein FRB99_001554 [Tulasnella sp. 403]